MVRCSFKSDPLDVNSPMVDGYFHGYFQEGSKNATGLVFCIVHCPELNYGKPFRYWDWQKYLYFDKHSDSAYQRQQSEASPLTHQH